MTIESFRRSILTIKKHNEKVDFNHRSIHRWFLRTDSDAITAKYSNLEVVLGDGNGYENTYLSD